MNGKIKYFNTEKNYGFILDDDSGLDYFFHANDVETPWTILVGDSVVFELGESERGPKAKKVQRS